jgi:hypothetical protein
MDYVYVDCGLICLGARRHTLAQIIGNARGLDINPPLSAEVHTQDLRFRWHQQRDDPNSARGLDNNFASDCHCDSMTTTRLCHRRLRPRRPRRTRQKLSSPLPRVNFYLPFATLDTQGLRYENHLAYHWLRKIAKALCNIPCLFVK